MYWQEEIDDDRFAVPEDVVDLAFAIKCKVLPVDHAAALGLAVLEYLPWLAEEPGAGVHAIHGAESGNGWERPEGEGDLIYLSRRTRLVIRMPRERVDQAREALEGRVLNVVGYQMEVLSPDVRPLAATTTVYARYVVAEPGEDVDEERFLARVVGLLRERGLKFKKVLCGKSHVLRTPDGPVTTRSLLVADMPLPDAVALQQKGIGEHAALGCGLFIPHKTV